jgi:proteasome accessory factor B
MLRIHEQLQRGKKSNCSVLAELLDVSTKTVLRDIEFMRDQLLLPLEYDPLEYSYHYTAEVENFPTVVVTEGELLALLVAQKALQQYEGTPFQRQLEASFEKLTAGLQDKISFSPKAEMAAVSFHNHGSGKVELKVYEALGTAAMRRNEVSFQYRKPGEQGTKTRHLRPYHIANRQNFWYVIGHDLEKGAIRTFALARISKVEVSPKAFVVPPDFCPDKFFGKSFGAFVGHGDFHISVRFDPVAAENIRERFWHETQEVKELENGEIIFSVNLNDLGEIERWILSFGSHAEALEPVELRAKIAETIRAGVLIYGK